MYRQHFIFVAVSCGLILLSCVREARAIVAPANTPADFVSPWTGTDWSFPAVPVYRWSVGSAVAVSPYFLLTAQHIDAVPGQDFSPDGAIHYTVTAAFRQSTVDLTLFKVDHALPAWEKLYSGSFTSGQQTILIGYGYSGTLSNNYYTPDTSTSQIKRWGTNTYDFTTVQGSNGFASTCIAMNFNSSGTTYEAGFAAGDSGGGTFVKVGDTWELAGVNAYAINNPQGRSIRSEAISMPAYYQWLLTNMTIPGDDNMDGKVSFADYVTLANNFGQSGTWYEGDFNFDGKVTFADYILLANNFGQSVPEPATLALLALGLLGLRRPRK